MLAKTPLGAQMYHWAAGKNPNEAYNWSNNCECACAQFADSIGKTDEWLSDLFKPGTEWHDLNYTARGSDGWVSKEDWTFGELTKRLSVYA